MKKKLFLVLVLSLLLAACAAEQDGYCAPSEMKQMYRRDLHALIDTGDLHGSFFLASGSISETLVYRFLEVSSNDGGFHPGEVTAEDAVVYEENIDSAWYARAYSSDADCVPEVFRLSDSIMYPVYWYEFHVPVGTVISATELDLQ